MVSAMKCTGKLKYAVRLLSVMVKRHILWVEISLHVFFVNVCKDDYCFVIFFEVD